MYYRRKLMLGILEEFGEKLNYTKLQKILFLVTRKQEKKSFDFVPYKYGCFSFQANQDLFTLSKYNNVKSVVVRNSSSWVLIKSNVSYYNQLGESDKYAIKAVKREINHFSQKELIRYTYLNFPYYATKSQIAGDILTNDEMNFISKEKKFEKQPAFFTIGYEGISLENYLNKLIINDIKLLCDVRKNSISMKYGFSKSQLKNACESIGIKYIHIPELGIESDKRQKLNTLSDYSKLFDEYEKVTLKENNDSLSYLYELIRQNGRVAITCFEKEVCMCHRGRILDALISYPTWNIPYKNL